MLIQKTFPSFGGAAAVLLLSILGVNQLLSPVLLRYALIRTGEVGQKLQADFATSTARATSQHGGP